MFTLDHTGPRGGIGLMKMTLKTVNGSEFRATLGVKSI